MEASGSQNAPIQQNTTKISNNNNRDSAPAAVVRTKHEPPDLMVLFKSFLEQAVATENIDVWVNVSNLVGEQLFTGAASLVDLNRVQLLQTTNGIRAIRVASLSGIREYLLFPHVNYCTCVEFKSNVLQRRRTQKLMCKHVLAGKIVLERYEKNKENCRDQINVTQCSESDVQKQIEDFVDQQLESFMPVEQPLGDSDFWNG